MITLHIDACPRGSAKEEVDNPLEVSQTTVEVYLAGLEVGNPTDWMDMVLIVT